MIRIAITQAAFAAVAATLPLARGCEPEVDAKGDRLLWADQAVADRLSVIRRPGESFSNVILRLIAAERRRAVLKRLWPSWRQR
jgi:hypothetical protein